MLVFSCISFKRLLLAIKHILDVTDSGGVCVLYTLKLSNPKINPGLYIHQFIGGWKSEIHPFFVYTPRPAVTYITYILCTLLCTFLLFELLVRS